jgi:hypothetical protein
LFVQVVDVLRAKKKPVFISRSSRARALWAAFGFAPAAALRRME